MLPVIDKNFKPQYLIPVEQFLPDGFKRVCKIYHSYRNKQTKTWFAEKSYHDYLFDTHNSWIYLIVVNGYVFKIGETGKRLAMPSSTQMLLDDKNIASEQPLTGSQNGRFGRLFYNPQTPGKAIDTDARIREELHQNTIRGLVSIYAKKCLLVETNIIIGGKKQSVQASIHKDLEGAYLRKFNPYLNKINK
jgi:hypothetical protein